MSNRKLLIVEDDPGLQKQIRWCFEEFTTFVAEKQDQVEAVLRKEEPAVITLDLGLPPDPGGTSVGFACLEMIQRLLPDSKVIVVTGREEREVALQAVAEGAYDFYQKPIDAQTLKFSVGRAFRLHELESENRKLIGTSTHMRLDGLVTSDNALLKICEQVEKVAPSSLAVAILGETGTGKEIVARNIHQISERSDGPFLAINCAAIPESLLESELFGHEKGAFTGATSKKIGRIEAANGGTLFLDEIGDMPLAIQPKLLRFLQERSFERLGGTASLSADVRIVCATHGKLEQMINAGTFREDLYYRLAEITFTLPPLRDRGEDSVLLASHFLKQFTEGKVRLCPSAEDAIRQHDWPGNVRELENRIKRASVLCEGGLIELQDLGLSQEAPRDTEEVPLNLRAVRAAAERRAITRALTKSEGNVSRAARLLGVSRPTLYSLFEKYEIDAK